MKSGRRYIPLVFVLTAFAVLLPAIASSATSTETVHALAPYSWSPVTATVTPGGSIVFKNESGINHGIIWTGGTAGATPICNTGAGENIPIGAGNWSTSWSGSCTFSKAGTYTYECSFHMALMRGTVTAAVPGAPAATTASATGVSETQATLNGTVNPEGKATSYFFNYGTSSSYGSQTSEQSAGEASTQIPVSSAVSSLSAGTTYHFQLVAKNAAGTTLGEDKTLVTPSPPGSPTTSTGLATAVSETEATLKGTVNPDGLATSYFFEWGTAGAYTQKTTQLQAGSDRSDHVESATLGGLAAGETYNFRIVAENTSGPSTGAAQVFTTTATPPSTPTVTTPGLPLTATPAPAVALPSPTSAIPPALGGTAAKLALARSQRGGAVHGTIQIPASDAGARLEAQLLAPSASLAKLKRSGALRVGRLIRPSVPAGSVSFAVSLNAAAKHALRRHRKLTLTLTIVLTPKHGAELTLVRSLVLHA